ncbi:NADH-quinone oxidoreductase subunit M [Solitalea sp. MAHUQ-68]|uniref:NADH-quinone oxidoreductase subunit M n=1 Tax=Solitalea agri TaxID=2953739 RepID=A0A9X2F690_9SPHI|nr:NADH-quinone oxidoreductase subunit M [Solitalea agri]MCO4292653.1 NADH-quinone oxidoreductase subunit M [Solitalea agri]
MILVLLIVVLITGGILAWLIGYFIPNASKWIALLSCLIPFLITANLWQKLSYEIILGESSSLWLIEINTPWIAQLGINFHLGLDGLSLSMLLLTFFLGTMAILCSWKEITAKQNFFYFNLLWVLSGITGVFLALDLFLFYFFWEVMLIPMYFMISIWGSERRIYSSYKFFLFTQASGLLMLLAIIALYFINAQSSGVYTFDYDQLLISTAKSPYSLLIAIGFFIAFTVKLPLFPFHTWLPDAHSEAPTAGSVILAGLMLKTGAYGLLRFVLPLFKDEAIQISNWAIVLGVISILYGALQAFGQTDLKRLVAYTSVSHMGFIVLGVFSFNELAMQGVVLQMITHGISTAALFILAGMLKERLHTRDINQMGGLWTLAPQMGSIGLVFAMASCGLPALGNFIAEFLILLGAFQTQPIYTMVASLGLVLSAIYSIRMMQKVFFGEYQSTINDFKWREKTIMGLLTIAIVFVGLCPQPIITMLQSTVNSSLKLESKQKLKLESSIKQQIKYIKK